MLTCKPVCSYNSYMYSIVNLLSTRHFSQCLHCQGFLLMLVCIFNCLVRFDLVQHFRQYSHKFMKVIEITLKTNQTKMTLDHF